MTVAVAPIVAQFALARLPKGWLFAATGALLLAAAAAILLGPVSLPPFEVVRLLLGHLPFVSSQPNAGIDDAILWQIRAPRVVLAGVVGAMLAVAGATYQGVFGNPLADPYLLGAASGAELGATLVIAYAPVSWGVNAVPFGAFLGALAAVMAAVLLGRSVRAGRSATVLILSGVAVASFLTAVQTYVQQQNANSIRVVYSFILGRLGTAGWPGVQLVLPYVVLSVAVIFIHRRHLDVLSLGDDEAASLGMHVPRVRLLLVVAATVGTAAVVALAGIVGFVGIIIPHTIRLLTGGSYRRIVPLSIIVGAAFLIVTDLLARTVVAPGELPIGVITALVGAPFFAVLLRRSRLASA